MRKTEAPRPAHQTLGQQGGTGEDGHVHLADWTLSVSGDGEEETEEGTGNETVEQHCPAPRQTDS